MSRSNSVERDSKPLPPVPQPPTHSLVESTSTSVTERLAQTLKKMSQDIPTTQYRSPLNIVGRLKHELSDMSREIVVPQAGRSTHHHDRYDRHDSHHREQESSYPVDPVLSSQACDGGESFTSAEKIRKNWEESQKSPGRTTSSHHKSSSGEVSRHRSAASPPTAFRSDSGFPWGLSSREHGRPVRRGSSRSRHRRERSVETPPHEIEIYDHSDDSGQSSIRLEIHNATPIYEPEGMKSRGRPGLTSRFRTSLSRIGVGSTRPARERTDISRSPSPHEGRRSPSPKAWRKPSPHSSIRATEQYSTPRTAGLPDALPRIESQKMNIDWEQPVANDMQSPPRPPDDAIPTIPDLNTPGVYHESGPRGVPILEPDKPRPVEIHEHPPSHRLEPSQATSTTAVNPPAPREYHHHRDIMDEHLVLRNFEGPFHSPGGHGEGPGVLKRLLSLNSKPVPIEGSEEQPARAASPTPTHPKAISTPGGIIRSTSLIRTRSQRKGSIKHREQRVEPDTHVGYESDPWGEGQEIHRDAQGNRIFPQPPKRKTSQKKKPTGPTKIALPMGQVEEFHSVHSNSPTEPLPPDPVSSEPMMLSVHKRTTSTTTFHTAQSETTRPASPMRKLSSQSTRQAQANAPDTKQEGWRRSRAGAPRRPSRTLLSSTFSNGNQYADEALGLHDHQPGPHQEYEQHPPENLDTLPPFLHNSSATDIRSQSPVPHETSAHIHRVPSPEAHIAAPPEPVPETTPSVRAPSPPVAPAPPPLVSVPPPLVSVPPPLVSVPPPLVSVPPPAPAPPSAAPVSRPLPSLPPPSPVTSAHMPVPVIPATQPPQTRTPQVRTPPPLIPASPEQSPPIQTPRAQSPALEDRHVHILPSDNLPAESHGYEDLPAESHRYEDPRYHPHTHSDVDPEVRSPVPDTPSYVLPRMPTPTLTSPGVLLSPPSAATSPTIDRQLSPRPASPARSVRIEYEERAASSMLSNRPMPRQLGALSESEQQQRQQNRQTGSEMSFVEIEPLSKREKLAASVLSISTMPWLRNRTSTRPHPHDSPYHSTHDGDSRYDRYRQPTDYLSSPTAPQLPPVHTTPLPRPDVGKLPSWYPREQAARTAAYHSSQQRESRGPRIGHEAWGWRSSPHHGIPEEAEETTPTTMPPWPYASGVVTSGPEMSDDLVRGESMMTPPLLPPRPAARTLESAVRPSGEKKRVPKYRIEQDERGHPVLVPEPGFDDSRWTVFEIGGVEFKRAPGLGESSKGAQWVPKRLSGLRRPESHRPYEYQYSESPRPIHAPLEGRQYD